MVRVPDWALEAAGQEMRGMDQDATSYQPGLYLPQLREKQWRHLFKNFQSLG